MRKRLFVKNRRRIFQIAEIVLVITIAGLAAGTSYILGGGSSGNVTSSATNEQLPTCGFYALSTYDTNLSSSQFSGPSSWASSTSISITLKTYETGGVSGAGYEYSVNEFALGCYNIPSSVNLYAVLLVCGLGVTATGSLSVSSSGAVSGATCSAPTTVESAIDADWVVMDTSVVSALGSGIPTTLSCGTNEAIGASVTANLYSDVATSGTPHDELLYQDTPALTSGNPTYSSNYYPAGVHTGGACDLTSNTFPLTIQSGSSGKGTVTLSTPVSVGTCSLGTCGYYLTFEDSCGAGNGPCGGSSGSGGGDILSYFNFAVVDEQFNGLETCIDSSSSTCALGSNSLTTSTNMFFLSMASSQ